MNKIEEMIQAERAAIEEDLQQAIIERDQANRRVAALRAKLDAAPRLHVRRTRKSAGGELADKVVNGEITEEI